MGRMDKLRRLLGMTMLPMWIGTPFMLVGILFVFGKPFGLFDEWHGYVIAVVSAAGYGVFTLRRYESQVVEHTGDSMLVRYERRTTAAMPRTEAPAE